MFLVIFTGQTTQQNYFERVEAPPKLIVFCHIQAHTLNQLESRAFQFALSWTKILQNFDNSKIEMLESKQQQKKKTQFIVCLIEW